MTDRACLMLAVLGLLIIVFAQNAWSGEGQPDRSPSEEATTSGPVADKDARTPDDLEDDLEHAQEAVAAGRWMVLAGLLIGLAVKGVRGVSASLKGRWLWLNTDRGGATLVLALAILGELGLSWAAGRPPSLQGLMGAVVGAFTAAGGRNVISRLLNPRDLPPRPVAT